MSRQIRGAARIWISTQLAASGILLASPCWAVSGTQFDNFSDGALHGWGFASPSTPIGNVAENGPSANDAGVGALHMDTSLYGNGNLLVTNASGWTGDWTGAAIARVAADVRNPNTFALSMHIGVAGAGGTSATGDVHVTPGITVAADNQWHVIVFDVLATNFTSVSGASTVEALSNVTQMRILHNPSNGVFTGAAGGSFLLDNIRVVAPSVPGDYNQNDIVDAADYVVWRDTLGSITDLRANGDTTGASAVVIDQADYTFWKARFGQTSGSGADASANATVPEPVTQVLLVFAASGSYLWRRRTA